MNSGGARRHNLPARLTSFVGREAELARAAELLGRVRLLTLTGAAGVGKTRLAIEVAGTVVDAYTDGVWIVELAALTDPALVPRAVADALGVPAHPGEPLESLLTNSLPPRNLLLVLDNCEHVVARCAALAHALLRAGPELRVLATSRGPLGVHGETTLLVPPLGVPSRDGAAAETADAPPIRLFIDRARAAAPDFALTGPNVAAAAEVCRRLDGIALAVELAAARVRALPVARLAARLDDRFRLLTGGARTGRRDRDRLPASRAGHRAGATGLRYRHRALRRRWRTSRSVIGHATGVRATDPGRPHPRDHGHQGRDVLEDPPRRRRRLPRRASPLRRHRPVGATLLLVLELLAIQLIKQ
jgi:predicted ATPase